MSHGVSSGSLPEKMGPWLEDTLLSVLLSQLKWVV